MEDQIKDLKEHNVEDAVLVLIANKTDMEEKRVVSREEGLSKARELNIHLFFEISVKCNFEQVEEVFLKVVSSTFMIDEHGLSLTEASRRCCPELWGSTKDQRRKMLQLCTSGSLVDTAFVVAN